VSGYYQQLSLENTQNMLRLVIHRHLDKTVSYAPVKAMPQLGIHHPDADEPFTDAQSFMSWQQQRPGYDPAKPRLGLLFFASFLTPGQQEPIDYVIKELEVSDFNVMACFGRDQQVIENFLLDE
jgi:cobaltochelatase CobN